MTLFLSRGKKIAFFKRKKVISFKNEQKIKWRNHAHTSSQMSYTDNDTTIHALSRPLRKVMCVGFTLKSIPVWSTSSKINLKLY